MHTKANEPFSTLHAASIHTAELRTQRTMSPPHEHVPIQASDQLPVHSGLRLRCVPCSRSTQRRRLADYRIGESPLGPKAWVRRSRLTGAESAFFSREVKFAGLRR